uniref:Auxin response factor n=1 Tax=Eucommia ulmoides TaxID=4392 RepID=A0A649UJZ5_EUCUL|nr:ARF4 [Eucommia ulmoides]
MCFLSNCLCLVLPLLLPLLITANGGFGIEENQKRVSSFFFPSMEIDLNQAVNWVEKDGTACGNGECDDKGGGGGGGCCLSSTTSSTSSNSSSSQSSSSIYMELWHACAGPLTCLPNKGNVVVYFPQGHLEQQASSSLSHFPSAMEMPIPDLKPQIFCRVMDVQLLANKQNDEVFTRLTLLPQPQLVGMVSEGKEADDPGVDEEGDRVLPTKSTPHMFCKTLTASDTSTHGGFSVPRRAAEDCFPPLDYTKQRPSQELVAKDLHGVEWKFRHIYRGQPRRHLLTTGWSIFVSQKNLVAGDAVLFLRDEGGDLRLGIRRAARPRNGLPDSIIKNQNSYRDILFPVANSISTRTAFHVFYSPRASHAEFVVPYQKYVKSITNHVPIGTRFKMRFDVDDSPERRFSGLVTGMGDLDPYRWPNSKWRCLIVKWDEDISSDHHERVSPWEIDPSVSIPPLSIQSSPRLKKMRTITQPDNPVFGRGGYLDFEESIASSKVLQGQEKIGSILSPLYGCDKANLPRDFEMQPFVAHQNLISNSNSIEKSNFGEFVRTHHPPPPTIYTGFVESPNRFPKVLQGQEICSLRSLTGKTDFNDLGFNFLNAYHQRPKPVFYPLASEGIRNMSIPYNGVYKPSQDHMMISYMANNSFPRENVGFDQSLIRSGIMRDEAREMKVPRNQNLDENLKNVKDDSMKGKGIGCKLFGFSLSEEAPFPSAQSSGKRSCTKVHKQGSLVGRAIDLSRLNSYGELFVELERLFGMEGLLQDPQKGWQILYTDSENDMMIVGDDPWDEFCNIVSKIHIYTREEVEKMNMAINGFDDTQSCLEEAPAILDLSKSSSVGDPDVGSPTEIRI